MSLDTTTLAVLRERARYERLAKAVPARGLDTRTQVLLTDFGRYLKDFPDVHTIQADSFKLAFRQYHPTLKEEDLSVYDRLFEQVLKEEVDAGVEDGLMRRLTEAATAYDVGTLIAKYQEGAEVDLRISLDAMIQQYDSLVKRKLKSPQVLDDIEDLLKAEANDAGFHFRLNCLNRSVKPLVGGDFLVLAARPDKGKTTMCCSELTFMAPQVDQLYPGEGRSILWFNNEGPGHRIVKRLFQSALGVNDLELVRLSQLPAEGEYAKYRTKIREEYVKSVGGRPGVLRVFDVHDMWSHEVEDIIRQYNPAIMVFDMVDNIRWGGEGNNGGTRTDQLLEEMYKWARNLAVKYDSVAIANSQLSGDADGLQYPTLPQLKDSKTGKQGAADVIVTMGAVNDPALENSRYIGCTKNKKPRMGEPQSPRQEVFIDGLRGRFVEPGE